MSSSASPATAAPELPAAAVAGRIPRASEEDEQSSGMFGDATVRSFEEAGVAAPPRSFEEAGVAAPPRLSPDSAETELLLPGGDAAQSEEEVLVEEEEEEHLPHTDPPWIHAKDTAVFDMDDLFTTTVAPTAATAAAAQPTAATNPAAPDVLHVDFFDPSSRGRGLDLAPPSPSSLAHELQGGDPTSWAMPESYDYLTPYEDGASPTADEYAYSTTTGAYESDDDLRLSDGSRPKPRAPGPDAGPPAPKGPAAAPPPPPAAASPVDGSDGMGGCRAGYQMGNGSCRSPCDTLPNLCYNGGQCYLMEGMGIFCR
ncbi:Chondroitin sulfate proteoglycan 5 [Liparis tanakae]|uniref:Chondroitin sulfate proteoglycan 5 n=1 Tax=Liparis tanakae TaxID=230148 RepID=A0A4Z2EAL7_9TELE|nr:Chondroitin sulfate proteoglycan 5 [Liparis tanakae]